MHEVDDHDPEWDGGVESLLARGTQALWARGDLATSRRIFDTAYRAAELADDGAGMARAALGLAGLRVDEHRTIAGVVLLDRLRRALLAVPEDSSLALRLRARLAGEVDYRAADHGAILAVMEEARAAGDATALAEALSLAHQCVSGPDHANTRRQLAEALIAESARTARRGDLLLGVLWRTVDLVLEGHPHADRYLTEARTLLAGADNLAVGYIVQAIDVMLEIRAGRFDRAEADAAQCLARGSAIRDADADGWYGAQLVAIRWFQGRIGELLPSLTDLVGSPCLSVVDESPLAALAVAYAAAGDRRQAAGALARLGGDDLARAPRSRSWLVTVYLAVEAAHILGDKVTAAQAYQLLLPFAKLPMVAGLGVACFGSVQHALGVAALTSGLVDTGIKHLEDAVSDNMAMKNWPATTLSRYRLAMALNRSADSAERVRAGQELQIAQHEAAELSMVLPTWPDADTARAQIGPPTSREVTCERQGRQWMVAAGGRAVRLGDFVGMTYLATLLANPGQEIAAVDLAVGPGRSGAAPERRAVTFTSQPLLDERAVRQYRRRLAVLEAVIDRCDARGDRDGAVQAHAERDWLLAELRSAAGLAGRTRSFATTAELARVSVSKALRRALRHVTAADPVVGATLSSSIRTGSWCVYRPYGEESEH